MTSRFWLSLSGVFQLQAGELCVCSCSSPCCRGPWSFPSEDTIPWKLCVAFPWSVPEDSMNQMTLADTLTTLHAQPASILSESPGLQAVSFLKHTKCHPRCLQLQQIMSLHIIVISQNLLKPWWRCVSVKLWPAGGQVWGHRVLFFPGFGLSND